MRDAKAAHILNNMPEPPTYISPLYDKFLPTPRSNSVVPSLCNIFRPNFFRALI
ncbi:hypothetical protein XBFFL1_910011 [Xenorhabdus bovienii str. feltiae Florida]|nr:hypothetical protein XBFFL1_910011 [Xenorhabdus bovienii str. feltiae Florida]